MEMERRSGLDLAFLFERRTEVYELLSPIVRDQTVAPGVLMLSVLSGHPDTWSVHLLAADAALRLDTSTAQVMEGFANERFDPISEHLPADWTTEGLQEFIASARFVLYAFTREAIAAATASTPRLEDCLRRDGSREQILECLRRA